MTIDNRALSIIKNNTHLPPTILQNVLQAQNQYVPIQQIAEIVAAIKEHNEAHMIVSPAGVSVRREDMDEIIQYALAGGMPQTFIKQ